MINLQNIVNRLKGRFFRNAGWIIGERIYQMGISLFVGLWTARYLGPTNYGVLNYVAAFVSFALPIVGLGLEGVLVKKYIDFPHKSGMYLGTAILMKFVASVMTSFLIVYAVSLFNIGDTEKTVVAVMESVALLFRSAEPIEFWYQAKLQSRYTSIIKMTSYTVMSAYRIILMLIGASVVWFALAMSVDMIIIAMLYAYLYIKQKQPEMSVDWKCARELIGESYHFIISGLMVVIYSQVDRIMIQQMLGDYEVGLYSAAYTICSLWFFIPNAVIVSSRPLIMEAYTTSHELYETHLKKLYASIFWMGVGVALLVTLLSPYIMFLLYGKEYIGASNTLSIGIWYGIFATLGSARGIWILCEKMNRYVKYYLTMGMVINLFLNYLFIPCWGIDGAATATLITQGFSCVFAPMVFRETRSHIFLLVKGIVFPFCRTIVFYMK